MNPAQRTLVTILLLALPAAAVAGERPARGSRALAGWFNVTAENGWRGRRYMDGDSVFAEEFASTPSGRIDVWRFYRRNVLTSEERDRNLDGRVDLQTRWNPANGFMESVLRDTAGRGVNDIEIERSGRNGWEIREDRNRDGITDRILFIDAPADAFDEVDLAATPDVTGIIPREVWREMWSDDSFSGNITDYFRYNRRGVLTHYGRWDGGEVAWRRVDPDFVPPTAAWTGPDPYAAPLPPPQSPQERPQERPRVDVPADPAAPVPPAPQAPDRGLSPYPAQAQAQAQREFGAAPAWDPAAPFAEAPDGDPYAGFGTQQFAPYPDFGAPASPPDILPSDESSARSVPARMRPPGSAGARRPRL